MNELFMMQIFHRLQDLAHNCFHLLDILLLPCCKIRLQIFSGGKLMQQMDFMGSEFGLELHHKVLVRQYVWVHQIAVDEEFAE
jgi:hypothetical protein